MTLPLLVHVRENNNVLVNVNHTTQLLSNGLQMRWTLTLWPRSGLTQETHEACDALRLLSDLLRPLDYGKHALLMAQSLTSLSPYSQRISAKKTPTLH